MKIVITTSSFGHQDQAPLEKLVAHGVNYTVNPYKRTLKAEEVTELVKGADGMIAGTEPLNRDVLKQLSGLKVISRCGVGMDNVDLDAAKEFGISVFSTPAAPTTAVAELTVGVILDLLRHVSAMDHNIRAGKWQKQMGHLLEGKNVGIVGFGRIGQKVAQLLKAFDANLGAYDIKGVSSPGVKTFEDLDSLLGWADIVTLHAAGGAGTLIGAKEIQKMKKGSRLINVSRGGLVDEKALCDALKDGHLAGAALDVFAKEPYAGPLKDFDQVILTPHVGSYAAEARVRMETEAVENLLKGLNL